MIIFSHLLHFSLQYLVSPLHIFVFMLQKTYQLTSLIYSFFHHFTLNFLFFHRYDQYQYYNFPMSFEFSNRIQELTNKLTQTQKNKDNRIEEAKQQLLSLQSFMSKELASTQKRMKKVENKLQKRITRFSRRSESVDEIVEIKEDKVTQVINNWVSEYQERLDHAKDDLKRQQLLFKTKLEEQDSYYNKQCKMMEDKIKNQIQTVQKEMNKWQSIHYQGQDALSREVESCKQLIMRDINVSREMKERQMMALEQKIKKVKENYAEKIEELTKKIEKESLKTSHIFELLLQV